MDIYPSGTDRQQTKKGGVLAEGLAGRCIVALEVLGWRARWALGGAMGWGGRRRRAELYDGRSVETRTALPLPLCTLCLAQSGSLNGE